MNQIKGVNFKPHNNLITDEEERIGKAIVHAAYEVHTKLGPGLLERVYETCMAHVLKREGFEVKRQVMVPIIFDDLEFDEGFKMDLFVNDMVIVEIKAVSQVNAVWKA